MAAGFDEALRRLGQAVDRLEAALVHRRDEASPRGGAGAGGDLETELQVMQDDRARLATELESATARLAKLETATDHVDRRVRYAVGSLREILSRAGEAGAP